MRRVLRLAGVLAAGLALAARPPQQAPASEDWLGVKEWWGSVEVTATSEGALRDGTADEFSTSDWTESETAACSFHLDHRSALASVFRGNTKPSLADLTERARWQSWNNLRVTGFEFSVEGDSESTTLVQSLGEARSVIRDSRRTEKTRGGAVTVQGTFMLQVDIRRGRYALVIPAMRAFQAPEVPVRGRWTTLHSQDPSGVREEDAGEESGTSCVRGVFRDAPDGEVDGQAFKILDQPLPRKVQELAGSMTFPMETAAGRKGRGRIKEEAVVSWTLSTTPPPAVELELEAEGDGGVPLAKWRPKGGPDEQTPGSFVTLKASVVSRGGPLSDKPVWIGIRLTSSSREKGVCLNFPEAPSGPPQDDFRFRDAENPQTRLSDTLVRARSPAAPELTARLACFDYGAWGEATATARLQSGRRLVATVKGRPGVRSLLLPERRTGSRIAASWNAAGSDGSDDDPDPPGDGQAGDGLSTYEEYRGFMVGGAWTDTDPAKKDFFIRNEAGAAAVPGIDLFESLSKLKVHRLAAGELAADRVINRNRTDGPHSVDQHGIRMIYSAAAKGYCQAVTATGRPGLPKDVRHVLLGPMPPDLVQADTGGGVLKALPYGAPTVAHELFHACNVWHHGDDQLVFQKPQLWTLQASGEIHERGAKISVVDEAGTTNVQPKLTWHVDQKTTKTVRVRTWQGTSSGDVGCVMRYDDARAFVPPGSPSERRWLLFGDETVGGGLCTSGNATGTNLPRGPLPARFGPAAAKRGNCAGQIVVNDKAKAVQR